METNLLLSENDEELGRFRAYTRAFNCEASGLVTLVGPDEGDKTIHGLLAVQEIPRKPGKLPECLVREAGPYPLSHPAACSSQYSDVWIEAIKIELAGLIAAGVFAEVADIPRGCNIVGAEWLYTWEDDSHGVVDTAKARMVAVG